jgi:hypothetical protein
MIAALKRTAGEGLTTRNMVAQSVCCRGWWDGDSARASDSQRRISVPNPSFLEMADVGDFVQTNGVQ